MQTRKHINDIVKVYPDMTKIIIYHRSYVITLGAEKQKKEKKVLPEKERRALDLLNQARSLRRTKTVVRDIILCNDFDYFCTFTFDAKKHNRYDIEHCKLTMMMWLKRQRSHSPNLKYLIVPELHKDGAIHFHALIANFNGKLTLLKQKTSYGSPIYNISNYKAGRISSAVPINENKEAVAKYMLKEYILKDMPLMFHKRRYWCSQNLNRPTSHVNGVDTFGLSKVIKGVTPDYIDDKLEVQFHDTRGSSLSKSSLSLNLPF